MTRVSLDSYVIDTLMPDLIGHDRHPSSFVVYLFLSRHMGRSKSKPLSLREIAEGTGLSKRAVQSAISRLERRRLIGVEREHITAVPKYSVRRPWRRRLQRSTRAGSPSR